MKTEKAEATYQVMIKKFGDRFLFLSFSFSFIIIIYCYSYNFFFLK